MNVWIIEYHVKGRRWLPTAYAGRIHAVARADLARWKAANPTKRLRLQRYYRLTDRGMYDMAVRRRKNAASVVAEQS